jgi:hypothetical protein
MSVFTSLVGVDPGSAAIGPLGIPKLKLGQKGVKQTTEGAKRLKNIQAARGAKQSVEGAKDLGLSPQGSGTSLLSNEELARSENFFKVSKSGNLTFLGRQPDAPLKSGEAIIGIGPSGASRVTAGDINTAKKVDISKLTRPKFAEEPQAVDVTNLMEQLRSGQVSLEDLDTILKGK